MEIYKPPVTDFTFQMETFGYKTISSYPQYEMFDQDTANAIMEEVGKFCKNEVLPTNRFGDNIDLQFDPETGAVTLPEEFVQLYQKFVDSGFLGATHPEAYGGMGAPHMMGVSLGEMVTATNKSFSMCPGLSHGLVDAVVAYGSEDQKKFYLPKLVSGEWTGTMCLTEPHAGTDLGMLKTKAVPNGDHFLLSGTKIWISFGDHNFTDNIIHLVLARLPDAPPGIKGISTFLVPKIRRDGTRNPIRVGGLEHKMGIHASPTCVMNLEGATGHLIGEAHKGMRTMFVMMNNARLGVAMEGVALGEIAYQSAVEFARERRQMRSLDKAKQDHDHPADTIIKHPDVRRMLANIKSTTEGMRGLAYYVSHNIDRSHSDPDEAARARADDLVSLLTPIIKSFFTDQGFENINEALQLCGGAGYTKDWPIEQYLRDLRIAMIYEGTNHIQALDLVGRKMPIDNGRLIRTFGEEVTTLIRECKEIPEMAEFITPLKEASKMLTEETMGLAMKGMGDPEEAGAVASSFLTLFGLTAVAFSWCHQARHALKRGDSYSATKLKSARYYMHNVLPRIHSLKAIMAAGKQHMMAFDESEF